MKQLIDTLENERKRLGITQKELASVAGLTQAYYSQVVDGSKAGITFQAFILMAERLNLSVKLCL